MKLKLDETGHAILTDGKPVYVYDDGKEIPFDAAGTVATIARLNGEAKGHREAKEQALNALKAFEGIEDAAAARAALETVKNFSDKKLVDAGDVERVKAEAVRAFEDKLKALEESYKPVLAERDTLRGDLHSERIGNAFSRSKFIADKLAVPIDMVQAAFGTGFKVEDRSIVGYDRTGNKIFSRLKPGDVAGFDEALEIMVDAYPFKDHILKGTGASGSGAHGGGRSGGARTITRSQLAAMSVEQAHQTMKDVSAGKSELVDD